MNIAFANTAVFWLLPVCLIPWLTRIPANVGFSTFELLPRDWLSSLLGVVLRFGRCAALALLLVGLAGPYVPQKTIERIGEGAQIVLLLDRSRSMDEAFGGSRNTRTEKTSSPKGVVARELLLEFVSNRRNDKYGMLVFSTQPIQVLPLTDKPQIIQAAIRAGDIGRGLSETDVGAGIIEALAMYENQPYTGSRVIMLVSDGGARLDKATRLHIADLLKRHRVALYWIYLRSRTSPGIGEMDPNAQRDSNAPARVLHAFFETLETPYRVFDAEDPAALASAIADVNELQSLPIRYTDVIPKRPISSWFFAAAMALVGGLLFAEHVEVRRW